MNAPATPIRSAAGILLRRRSAPRAPFLVARRPELAFFGGYWAFPGGTVDGADGSIPVALHPDVDDADRPFVAAAARELFEETGVLCVRGTLPAAAVQNEMRRALLAGTSSFADVLGRHGLEIDGARFVPLCRMTTPIFSPVRYETLFFIVDVDDAETPEVDRSELDAGAFSEAAQVLERWRQGELLVVPPAIILLEILARVANGDPTPEFRRSARALTESYARGKIHQVYFTPGVRKLTLLTETLPPANHTNAYLVGTDRLYLVDPGATRPEEHAKLFEALEESIAGTARLVAVLLTHAHRDHVGAVSAVVDRWRVPVWAHADTARALEGRIPVARQLSDGERLPLGRSPDGRDGWTLEVLHTPGHMSGHLAFRESRYGAILAGDMVSTVSTIMIAPPDGHLRTYLDSLRRLRALPAGTLYPAHGPAKRDSHAVLDGYLAHRAERERKVLGALAPEPRGLDEILQQAYDDVSSVALPFARRSLEAGLLKLCEDGVVAERDGRYRTV